MKKGWQKQRLTAITVKITDGSHNPPKGVAESDYLMLSSKNIFDDDLHYTDPRYLTAEQYQQEDKRTGVVPDDVLLTIVGTIGRSAVVPADAPRIALQRSVAVIRPNRQLIEPRFLMYSFIERCAELNDQARGVAQKGIYLESLRELSMMLPPLAEQKRIVGLLDEAFAGLATAKTNAEKNLKNARALFESHLQSVFTQRGPGWGQERMVELCSIITCGVASTPKYVDETVGIPFLSAQNVKDGEVSLKKYRFISREFHEKLTKNNKPKAGDILYSRVGAKYGEAAVVEHDFEFSVYVSLTLIRPIATKLDSYFLKYYLNSPSLKLLAKNSISSSGVPNLNVNEVREFPVSYPSIEKQRQIVNELKPLYAETQRLARLCEQKLAALDALKKSLLHRAFSGQL